MSRRPRTKRPQRSAAKPEAARAGLSGWKHTLILAVLACAATAAFFWQLLDETSFFSAIRGVEKASLSRGKSGARAADHPTWDDLYVDLRNRLSALPCARGHAAVAQLLRLVIEIDRGKKMPAEVLGQAQNAFNTDANNLISRLAYAYIADRAAMSDSSKSLTALQRFEAMSGIFDQSPPATTSTLYNEDFTSVWREILGRHIKRRDVAANLAVSLDHYQITDHYAALPIIQAFLATLTKDLLAVGRQPETVQCTTWITQTFSELAVSELDSGTGLLCADLIRRSLPEGDTSRGSLQRLRDDYRARTSQAIPDLTSPMRTPAPISGPLMVLIQKTLGAASLAAVSLGAGLVSICAMFAAVVALIVGKRDSFVPNATAKRQTVLKATIVAAIALLCVIAGMCRAGDLYSEQFVHVWILGFVALGAANAILLACLSGNVNSSFDPIVLFGAVLLGLTCTAFVPGKWAAPMYREIDMRFSFPILEVALIAVLILIGIVLNRQRLASVARSAAITWLILILFATTAIAESKFVDGDWTLMIYAARKDELSALLGSGWAKKYGVFDATEYDLPGKNEAKSP